jgi:hypothetical protein
VVLEEDPVLAERFPVVSEDGHHRALESPQSIQVVQELGDRVVEGADLGIVLSAAPVEILDARPGRAWPCPRRRLEPPGDQIRLERSRVERSRLPRFAVVGSRS